MGYVFWTNGSMDAFFALTRYIIHQEMKEERFVTDKSKLDMLWTQSVSIVQYKKIDFPFLDHFC